MSTFPDHFFFVGFVVMDAFPVGRMRAAALFLATLAKKVGEERAALFSEQAGVDIDLVVELRMVHDGEDAAAGSGFGVGGGVDEAGDAGVEDGSSAHGAGLERGVEDAVFEAVVGEMTARFAEGDDLGVGCRVAVAEDSILASANDFSVVNDYCAYGNFAGGFGSVGFGDGGVEMLEVGHVCGRTCGFASGPKKRAICWASFKSAGRR